jgi:hypothetical protein
VSDRHFEWKTTPGAANIDMQRQAQVRIYLRPVWPIDRLLILVGEGVNVLTDFDSGQGDFMIRGLLRSHNILTLYGKLDQLLAVGIQQAFHFAN